MRKIFNDMKPDIIKDIEKLEIVKKEGDCIFLNKKSCENTLEKLIKDHKNTFKGVFRKILKNGGRHGGKNEPEDNTPEAPPQNDPATNHGEFDHDSFQGAHPNIR